MRVSSIDKHSNCPCFRLPNINLYASKCALTSISSPTTKRGNQLWTSRNQKPLASLASPPPLDCLNPPTSPPRQPAVQCPSPISRLLDQQPLPRILVLTDPSLRPSIILFEGLTPLQLFGGNHLKLRRPKVKRARRVQLARPSQEDHLDPPRGPLLGKGELFLSMESLMQAPPTRSLSAKPIHKRIRSKGSIQPIQKQPLLPLPCHHRFCQSPTPPI